MNAENKKVRAEKQAITEELRGQVEDSLFVILTDYRGLNVTQTSELRGRLHSHDAKFHVVKNSLLRHASRGLPIEELAEKAEGPTAMVVGTRDVVEVAKVLRGFIKDNQIPVIRIGSLSGVILSSEEISELAKLPGRTELRGMVVGTLAAPLNQMVGVLNQKVLSLLYVLRAIEEKKEAA